MTDTPERYLRYLEMKVLRRLDGVLQGDYAGLFYGPGMDLGEVREYQPGDDVRHIDWNVTARTNRAHVRQFVEEREITAWLVCDLSGSIGFGTALQSKRDLLRQFAGIAARLYARHGNNIGLFGFGAGPDVVVPPRTGRVQALRILDVLDKRAGQTGGGETDLAGALLRVGRLLRRRGLVFIVSDFLTPMGWQRPLQQLGSRHDVVAVRLVDPLEQELPNVGWLQLQDPETGDQAWVDTGDAKLRERYRQAAVVREEEVRSAAVRSAVDFLTISTAESLVQPLLRFVALRKRRRQWSSPGR